MSKKKSHLLVLLVLKFI